MRLNVSVRAMLCGATAVLALLGVGATEARADILVDFTPSVAFDSSTGYYRWTYNVSLQGAQQIRTFNFFTIYDFFGLQYLPGTYDTTEAPGWTFSTQPFEPANPILPPPCCSDDPSVPNLKWTYTDTATINPSSPDPAPLGTFSALSTIGPDLMSVDWYSSIATNDQSGALDPNAAQTQVPATVPEPGSMFLLGSGLLGAASLARRRKKQKSH